MSIFHSIIGIVVMSIVAINIAIAEPTLEGYAAIDVRLFPYKRLFDGQGHSDYSLVLQPELYHELNDGGGLLSFIPFARLNSQDTERSHADIRELAWRGASNSFEWTLGISKVFWGVTESQHLVDIINQTDLVEEPDLETKLGQPMLGMTWVQDWGHIEGYILPGFRERTFAGSDGRLHSRLLVDQDKPVYDSSKKEKHIDAALRIFGLMGDTELGVSYFYGTSRDPDFQPAFDGNAFVLRPHYKIIHQFGIDALHLVNSWTWKFEGYHRSGDNLDDYHAITSGFEYTYTGGFIKGADINLMLEYMYDSRDDRALTPFEHDIFAGIRIALNDLAGTDIRLNAIIDKNNSGVISTLEISSRISNAWKAKLLMRSYSNMSPQDYIYDFRNDDYINLELTHYF